MGRIYCRYEIFNPKEEYNPNDEIEGKFYIENQEKKEKKLKKVEIHFVEKFEQFYDTGGDTGYIGWRKKKKVLQKYPIAKNENIRSGEIKEFPFKIKLNDKWVPRSGVKYNNWHLGLRFLQKTGIKATQGADKDSGFCILPVRGSLAVSSLISAASVANTALNQVDMKFCSECGQKIKRTAKFCEHCGAQS
ncbi:MAG: zinc-ribbon domain-containing protein [Promethearchaeota archaeon]